MPQKNNNTVPRELGGGRKTHQMQKAEVTLAEVFISTALMSVCFHRTITTPL